MRRLILIILQAGFISLGSYLFSFADDSAGLVNKANSLYRQKKYDEAIKLYNQAQIKAPDSTGISYNIGIAQYKKGAYNAAISSLEKATVSKDKVLESKANYNIGNAKYKLGKLKENTDLKETVSLLRQCLDYYKRAIELNVKDEDAKINHELVEKELKTLLDKLKQEQDKKKEHSEQQQAAQAQEDKTEEQQRQEAKQSEEQKEKQGQESSPQAAEEAREMSEKEASMLLEGYRQEESSSGKLDDKKRGYSGDVLKDW